jgi:hypothetical protein
MRDARMAAVAVCKSRHATATMRGSPAKGRGQSLSARASLARPGVLELIPTFIKIDAL